MNRLNINKVTVINIKTHTIRPYVYNINGNSKDKIQIHVKTYTIITTLNPKRVNKNNLT